MKCLQCGAGISQEMKNCPHCGTGLNLPPEEMSTGEATPKIEIHIQSNFDNDPTAVEESRNCPKCKAKIPLSSIIVAKRPPTIGQWIWAGIFALTFIACFRIQVKESGDMYLKVILLVLFGDLLGLLLWVMFTRRLWICPACHKAIRVKRYPTEFQQNRYQNIR